VVGGKGSGGNTVIDIETFLEVFARLSDIGIFFLTTEVSGYPVYQHAD
jgi:hypothetical protein